MGIASGSTQFHVTMDYQGVAADTGYVLVDLSDTTNFKHNYTNAIYVQKIQVFTEKATSGDYDLWFGVVTEVDATNGSVHFFDVAHIEALGNPTDSTDRCIFTLDYTNFGNPDGICLDVDTTAGSEKPRYFLSNATQSGQTTWQTDTGLGSPAGAAGGATGKPGAGDLVLYCEEVTGGTIDFCIRVDYKTI